MTPAKKAAPSKSLSDLLGDKSAPEVENPPVIPDAENPPVVDDDEDLEDAEAQDENPEDDPLLVPADKNPVHTWEENHDHNLARLHPDVITPGVAETANTVTKTTTEFVYADEAELDDKGRKDVFDRDEDYVD